MSKQSEAKERQEYTPKFIPSVCSNCAHFRSEFEQHTYGSATWTKEVNLRCGIGGFAVKKGGSCAEWAGIDPSAT